MNTQTLSDRLPCAKSSDEVNSQPAAGNSPGVSLRRMKNLAAIGSVLADHGFDVDLTDEAALKVALTSGNTLVVTHNQERGHFVFTVEVASLADLTDGSDKQLADLHGKMLSANIQLQPFALAFIPDTDGDAEDESVYCLVNGVSDKDFSTVELLDQVRDLEQAIQVTDGLLSACGC